MGQRGTVLGAILAGGLARRMGGGDKCLLHIRGRPILVHIVGRLQPQCDALLLNANGDPARFAGFGLPVVADGMPDHAGPLAGLLAVLDAAAGGAALPRSPQSLARNCQRRHPEETEKRASRRKRDGGACFETRTPAAPQHDAGRGSYLRQGSQDEEVDGVAAHILTVPGDTPFLPRDLAVRLAAARDAAGARIAIAASRGRSHPTVGLWPLALREDLRSALAEGERSIGRFARRFPLAVAEWDETPDPFLNLNDRADLERAEHAGRG